MDMLDKLFICRTVNADHSACRKQEYQDGTDRSYGAGNGCPQISAQRGENEADGCDYDKCFG